MSTWHQRQRPVPLWHETKWTAVFDPPNSLMSVSRFDTAEAALQACGNQPHSYVIPPSKEKCHERKNPLP